MTPARWQLFLLCRDKALGGDRQLMMVREPEYHGTMIARALMDAAAQQLAQHVIRSRLAVARKPGIIVPKVAQRKKGRRR